MIKDPLIAVSKDCDIFCMCNNLSGERIQKIKDENTKITRLKKELGLWNFRTGINKKRFPSRSQISSAIGGKVTGSSLSSTYKAHGPHGCCYECSALSILRGLDRTLATDFEIIITCIVSPYCCHKHCHKYTNIVQ